MFEDLEDDFVQYDYRDGLCLPADEEARCGHLLSYLGDRIDRLAATASPTTERFFRAVRHFLRGAAVGAHRVRPRQETVFQWMTALEVLLSSGEQRGGYVAAFRTNAAWLGGLDDSDRHNIRDLAHILYDAGSKYRHGGALYELNERGRTTQAQRGKPGELDVPKGDRLVRRLLLHGVALLSNGEDIPMLCGRAQYQRAAADRLVELLKSFYDDLHLNFTPFS